MNVIRQDVVEIIFKPNFGGLDKVNAEMDKLKNTTSVDKGLSKISKGFEGIYSSTKKTLGSFRELTHDTSKFASASDGAAIQAAKLNKALTSFASKNAISGLKADIETGGAALGVLNDKFNNFKKTVKGVANVAAHPFKALDKQILAIQMSTGRAVSSFKNLAKTKINKVSTDFKNLKETLTGGEKGARGFKNALSNIGKISIAKTISGFEKLKSTLPTVKTKVKELATKIKEFATSLKNVAKTSMTKLMSGLQKVASKLSTIAKKAAGAAFKGLKKMAGVSFKALSAGLGAAATAVGAAVTKSVSAYSDYQQLTGGMRTLLGAKEAESVQEYAKLTGKSVEAVSDEYKKLKANEAMIAKNANNAFKTSGMSANQYMETITTFSAALKKSLGGDSVKAAKLADVAIQDMGDNANKMGNDLESVSIVYSGLARGIYTTLDNLKLGENCIAQYKPCENGENLMLAA